MIVALGSNQSLADGSPKTILEMAIGAIADRGAVIRKMSQYYETPCFPAGAGPDFVNAVCMIETRWTPERAITELQAIEQDFGRERFQRWGQRTLDLDLIAVEDVVCPSIEIHDKWRELNLEAQKTKAPTELIIPHPRLQDRAFVLVPLMDIAPDWVHPIMNLTVQEMLGALPDGEKEEVILLNG